MCHLKKPRRSPFPVIALLVATSLACSPTALVAPVPTPPSPTLAPTVIPTTVPSPSLTPPGRDAGRIAFTSNRDGNLEIYAMHVGDPLRSEGANDSEPINVTNSAADDWYPTWSPASLGGGAHGWPLSPTAMAMPRSISCMYPAWSPDGTQIAFSSDRDGNGEIYVLAVPDGTDSDGSRLTRLTNHPASDSNPTWSPDGTRIAFTSNRDA